MSLHSKKYVYPFSAVIGQEKVKKALVLNLINPMIGGVILSGEKGTAKSTLVRGLAALLSEVKVVDLPLNVTEDMLIGTISIEKAIKGGEKSFEPGLLEKADRNILYVDEVNLLSDHIVNCLLDVSQSGINMVEREGISYSHDSRFVLIGTMNPEEGVLRSEFLDRFGLYVEVEGTSDIQERKEIIQKRLEYEKNSEEFLLINQSKTDELTNRIRSAKEKLNQVEISDNIVKLAADIALKANCSGHRADLVIIQTAKALAAWEGRSYITLDDIKEAAELALPHRTREQPPAESEPESQENQQEESEEQTQEEQEQGEQEQQEEEHEESDEQEEQQNQEQEEGNSEENDVTADASDPEELDSDTNDQTESLPEMESEEDIQQGEEIFRVKNIQIQPMDRMARKGSGRRSKTKTSSGKGRYVRYQIPKGKVVDIALDATIRAAAPYQKTRDKQGRAIAINNQDFRKKIREKRVGTTILFAVDSSGSMGANKRMKATKEAILSLLQDAYQKRDMVGMVAFRKNDAELLLGITRSVELAQKCLQDLPTGGRTPLATGLMHAYQVLKGRKLKDPEMVPLLVLVTDGRANVSLRGNDPVKEAKEIAEKIATEKINTIVIDTEKEFITLGLAKEMADIMGAQYFKIEDLKGEEIQNIVKAVNY